MAFKKPNVYYGDKSYSPDVVDTSRNKFRNKKVTDGRQQVDSDGVVSSLSGFGTVSTVWDKRQKKFVETYEVLDAVPGHIMRNTDYVELSTDAGAAITPTASVAKISGSDNYRLTFGSSVAAVVSVGDEVFQGLADSQVFNATNFAFTNTTVTLTFTNSTTANTIQQQLLSVINAGSKVKITIDDATTGGKTISPASASDSDTLVVAVNDSSVTITGASIVDDAGSRFPSANTNYDVSVDSFQVSPSFTTNPVNLTGTARTTIAAVLKAAQRTTPSADTVNFRRGRVMSVNTTVVDVAPVSVNETWPSTTVTGQSFRVLKPGKTVLRGQTINNRSSIVDIERNATTGRSPYNL